ncbi:MAG: ATP synthase F1 subunit epsilon [Planctomycetota bacterium]
MADPLQISVVTPEETVVETTADSVVVPLFDGEIGILPKHAPMIGRLGYGEMRLTTGGETTSYYVDGGFVQVSENAVSVLTGKASAIADLNADAAKTQLEEGLKRVASGEDEIAIRDRLLSQARAQLRLVSKI